MPSLLHRRLRALSEQFFDEGNLTERDAIDWLLTRLPNSLCTHPDHPVSDQLYAAFKPEFDEGEED